MRWTQFAFRIVRPYSCMGDVERLPVYKAQARLQTSLSAAPIGPSPRLKPGNRDIAGLFSASYFWARGILIALRGPAVASAGPSLLEPRRRPGLFFGIAVGDVLSVVDNPGRITPVAKPEPEE
jgi:hypothetical protein